MLAMWRKGTLEERLPTPARLWTMQEARACSKVMSPQGEMSNNHISKTTGFQPHKQIHCGGENVPAMITPTNSCIAAPTLLVNNAGSCKIANKGHHK